MDALRLDNELAARIVRELYDEFSKIVDGVDPVSIFDLPNTIQTVKYPALDPKTVEPYTGATMHAIEKARQANPEFTEQSD